MRRRYRLAPLSEQAGRDTLPAMGWEDIGTQVVAGVILLIIGGVGAWAARRWSKGDRPGTSRVVKFLPKVIDYGEPIPGFITWRVGEILEIEVHPLLKDPIMLLEIGLEMVDGSRIELGTSSNLGKPIRRPEFAEAEHYIKSIRKDAAKTGSAVTGFYARATPDKIYRQALPKDWRGFPEKLPPNVQTG